MRTRTLGLVAAMCLAGGGAAGCVTGPDYDFQYQMGYPPPDRDAALVYARSRVVAARRATWAGWGALATGVVGMAVCSAVAVQQKRLDDRAHWKAPWELWAGLAGAGAALAGWGGGEVAVSRRARRGWEAELGTLEVPPERVADPPKGKPKPPASKRPPD